MNRKIVLAFGRFNPPTIGHQKLIEACATAAQQHKCDYKVYMSVKVDKAKNPLSAEEKLWFMHQMFPTHAKHIFADTDVSDPFLLLAMFNKEYDEVVFIAGSDRVSNYETQFNKHMNGPTATFYYGSLVIQSSGERDPDSEGASGMSASKMRAAVKEGDIISFRKGIPKTLGRAEMLMLYNAVHDGMGL